MKLTKKQINATNKYQPELLEIRNVLKIVRDYGDMPKGKAHLFSKYHAQGLIDMPTKTKHSALGGGKIPIYGNRKVKLTKKGKEMLKVL